MLKIAEFYDTSLQANAKSGRGRAPVLFLPSFWLLPRMTVFAPQLFSHNVTMSSVALCIANRRKAQKYTTAKNLGPIAPSGSGPEQKEALKLTS